MLELEACGVCWAVFFTSHRRNAFEGKLRRFLFCTPNRKCQNHRMGPCVG